MRGRTQEQSPHALVSPAVYGLDAGRSYARRAQRGRRLWNQTVTFVTAIVVAAGIVAGIWFGYQAYLDHTKNAEIEHQLGVEEQARKDANESMVDVIDNLEQTPAFNGPGAPALGIGSDTTQP